MKTNLVTKTLITGMILAANSAAMAEGLISSGLNSLQNYKASKSEVILSDRYVRKGDPDDSKADSFSTYNFADENGIGNGLSLHFHRYSGMVTSSYFKAAYLTDVTFEKISNTTAKGLTNLTQTLGFRSLGDNGGQLITEVQYNSPALTQILPSGTPTLRVRQTWQLSNCDGNDIDISPSTDSISDAISKVRALDFNRYMVCTLTPVGRPSCSDHPDNTLCQGSAAMNIKDDGDVEMTSNRNNFCSDGSNSDKCEHGNYTRNYWSEKLSDSGIKTDNKVPTITVNYQTATTVDARKQVLVENSARAFVRGLKEYGNLVFSVQGLKPAERNVALQAWMNKNKGKLVQLLSTIEQNMNGVSALEKLSVVTTINQGYAYIQMIEDSVTQGQFSFADEVVGSGF